jgi:hypothetical protein
MKYKRTVKQKNLDEDDIFWDITQCSDVSEGYIASIIRAISRTEAAPMMEAVCTFKTSDYFYETTWHYVPEGCHLHVCHCENLKSHQESRCSENV